MISQYIDMKILGLKACFESDCHPADAIANAISNAATREGVILHQCDVVGIHHTLSEKIGHEVESTVQQAICRLAGVSPEVVLYGDDSAEASPLSCLCAQIGSNSCNHSDVVLIQGAAH